MDVRDAVTTSSSNSLISWSVKASREAWSLSTCQNRCMTSWSMLPRALAESPTAGSGSRLEFKRCKAKALNGQSAWLATRETLPLSVSLSVTVIKGVSSKSSVS